MNKFNMICLFDKSIKDDGIVELFMLSILKVLRNYCLREFFVCVLIVFCSKRSCCWSIKYWIFVRFILNLCLKYFKDVG